MGAGEGRISWEALVSQTASSPTRTPEGKESEGRNSGSQGVAVGRHSLLWGGAPAYPGRSPCPGWVAAGPHPSLQVRG